MLRYSDAKEGKYGGTQQAIAHEGMAWIELLLKKNADYGDSAFKVPKLASNLPVESAILVRMSDKVERISKLTEDPDREPEIDESLDDTIMDLGAYCLLYLVAKKLGNIKAHRDLVYTEEDLGKSQIIPKGDGTYEARLSAMDTDGCTIHVPYEDDEDRDAPYEEHQIEEPLSDPRFGTPEQEI